MAANIASRRSYYAADTPTTRPRGPRCLKTSAKDANYSDTRVGIYVRSKHNQADNARPCPGTRLAYNDRRGVLDLRMKACAEPLGLGVGRPHHRPEYHRVAAKTVANLVIVSCLRLLERNSTTSIMSARRCQSLSGLALRPRRRNCAGLGAAY